MIKNTLVLLFIFTLFVIFPINVNSHTECYPDIQVSDSIISSDDREMNFGEINLNNTNTQTITVTNVPDCGANLTISSISIPFDPFFISSDECSGQIISEGNSCNINIEFNPTIVDSFEDSIIITSNGWDNITSSYNPIEVDIFGKGVIPSISVHPESIYFGHIYINDSSKPYTITITNMGSSDLNISNIEIAGSNYDSYELIIDNNSTSCGSTTSTIESNGDSCTIDVIFKPKSVGIKQANLIINSDDPNNSKTQISLNGNTIAKNDALSVVENDPPENFELISPLDKTVVDEDFVTLSWNETIDPNGDNIIYYLYICEDSNFEECDPIMVDPKKSIITNNSINNLNYSLLVFGFIMPFGIVSSRKKYLLAILMIITVMITSCGQINTNDLHNNPNVSTNVISYTITNLDSGKTYYWKVVAIDEFGAETQSEIRSFTIN